MRIKLTGKHSAKAEEHKGGVKGWGHNSSKPRMSVESIEGWSEILLVILRHWEWKVVKRQSKLEEQTRVRRKCRELRTGARKIRRSWTDRGRFGVRKEKYIELEGGGLKRMSNTKGGL